MRVTFRLIQALPATAVLIAALCGGLLVSGSQSVADESPTPSSTSSGLGNSGPAAAESSEASGSVSKSAPAKSAEPSVAGVRQNGSQGRIVIEDADGRQQEYALPMEMLPFTLDSEEATAISDQPRCMIGVICQPPPVALRQHLKLGQRGLLVTGVSAGLPADTAGIQEGDLLLKAGEKDLTCVQDLVEAVAAADQESLKIQRLHKGELLEVSVAPCKATDQDAFATLPADDQAERLAEFLKQLPLSDAERKAFQKRIPGQTPMLQRFFGPALEFRDTADLDRNMAGLMRDAESSRAAKSQATEPQSPSSPKSDQQEIKELRQLVRELSLRVQKLEAER